MLSENLSGRLVRFNSSLRYFREDDQNIEFAVIIPDVAKDTIRFLYEDGKSGSKVSTYTLSSLIDHGEIELQPLTLLNRRMVSQIVRLLDKFSNERLEEISILENEEKRILKERENLIKQDRIKKEHAVLDLLKILGVSKPADKVSKTLDAFEKIKELL